LILIAVKQSWRIELLMARPGYNFKTSES